MSDCVADENGVFMDSSVNESPYFVHEPSTNSSVKKSAKVSHADLNSSPSSRHHLSNGDCLEDKIKIVRSVLCCAVYDGYTQ